MYLFGGKFCMLSDGSRDCNCDEIVNRHPQCVCDRKHFNNILWATVTVFQVSRCIMHTFVVILTMYYLAKYLRSNKNLLIVLMCIKKHVIE